MRSMRELFRKTLGIGGNVTVRRSVLNIAKVEGDGVASINYGGQHYRLHLGGEYGGHRVQYRGDGRGGLILLDSGQNVIKHIPPGKLVKKTVEK